MKRSRVIIANILLLCCCFSLLWAASENEKAAQSAAKAWLSLIDKGDYPGGWKGASTYFQGAISEQNWVTSLEGFRRPLGGLVSRKRVKAQESSSLPGVPDGRYVVMSFKTSFEQKKSAIETVTFMLDKDGKWRAAGYFIK